MDTNDFIGSFAQENVAFATQIVRTNVVGDNYWKVLIFVEDNRFVDSSSAGWQAVPGFETAKALSVTVDDYASHTSGLLRSWLYDLFCNGFTGDCILVACGTITTGDVFNPVTLENGADITGMGYYHRAVGSSDAWELAPETVANTTTYEYASKTTAEDPTAFISNMETAYGIMKPYAYHKTVCAGSDTAINPAVAARLAELCGEDKGLLSSAPYYPFTTTTPEDPMTDPIFTAIKGAGASADAFMSAHQDITRNAALYSLGIALATLNGSGTSVGNSMDMVKSSNITCSGPEGRDLGKPIRTILKGVNVQTFKPVGNNSGMVAAEGAETLKGDTVQATWILAYITYMVKVRVAELITTINYLKNAANYRRILNVLIEYLGKFGTSGSQRLEDITVSAPAFGALPEAAGDQIIIPNAWSAQYVDQVRNVQITGTLYIGA